MFIYRLPNFNLLGNIWHGYLPGDGTVPTVRPPGAPDVVNVPMQKAGVASYWAGWVYPSAYWWQNNDQIMGGIVIRCPKVTDLRGVQEAGGSDVVELPAGSGKFYLVTNVELAHEGFPNEYMVGVAFKVAW